MISTFLFFIFYSSAVLFYGIGIKHSVVSSKNIDFFIAHLLKSLINIVLSLSLSWFAIRTILTPLLLQDLFFPVCLLCYLPINALLNFIFKTTFNKTLPEFSVSLLCIILSITHSSTFIQALVIALACSSSYYLFIPILFAIRKRLEYADPVNEFKTGSLIFISISVIMLTLFAFTISWIPLGGL